ncbi:MAG TPA: hypothetical protein VHM70_26725 [Polyangiaceae bacterium]|nr:hypothetical protein [Polyangiaceae bacterium]
MSRTLLIVDDRSDVLTALERFMSIHLKVFTARTLDEAERLLEVERPDYLLCDYSLGEGVPPATSVIPGWRQRHPELQLVALMTGARAVELTSSPSVDEVFQKPLDVRRLAAFFEA